ncbi:MAG: metallophosphoesterase, partial [Andreesenia angusta]|nr:metallophosphoesterase [Andreesenia angusta]
TGEKPMDVFGGAWENYEERLFNNIEQMVNDDDILLLPGDISWALKLNGAIDDLNTIDKFPGRKYISKGNHDYWWGTINKMSELNLKSIKFVQTNSYIDNGVGICGTRGWTAKDSETFSEKDLKIFNRELNRLKLSLESLENKDLNLKIAMIHYPPFNFSTGEPNEFAKLMSEYEVDICIYGHLHAEGHKFAREGNFDGVNYHLVSCDYLNMIPKRIY